MPVELVDIDEESKASEVQPSAQAQAIPTQPAPSAPSYPGGYAIDVAFEASKLPLDVAIFNSARAAGGDEKIRKYLQAVLVIGGTALIPGTAHALESR
jgi:actin-related protein 8